MKNILSSGDTFGQWVKIDWHKNKKDIDYGIIIGADYPNIYVAISYENMNYYVKKFYKDDDRIKRIRNSKYRTLLKEYLKLKNESV